MNLSGLLPKSRIGVVSFKPVPPDSRRRFPTLSPFPAPAFGARSCKVARRRELRAGGEIPFCSFSCYRGSRGMGESVPPTATASQAPGLGCRVFNDSPSHPGNNPAPASPCRVAGRDKLFRMAPLLPWLPAQGQTRRRGVPTWRDGITPDRTP